MRAFAISDIHGCSQTLNKLLQQLNVTKDDKLFFLGDYIDRGPDSKGVVDILINLGEQGYNIECLKGNHEDQFQSVPGSYEWQNWMRQGGQETLDSFQINSYTDLDKKYSSFFDSLKFYIEYDGFLLVHAGFNFQLEDPFEDTRAMMWIRGMEYDSVKANNKRIVHGHTPQKLKAALKAYQNDSRIINIDCGCVYKNKEGMGYLCCFELQSNSFHIQRNID